MKEQLGYIAISDGKFIAKTGNWKQVCADITSSHNFEDDSETITYTGLHEMERINQEVSSLNTLVLSRRVLIHSCASCGRYFIYTDDYETYLINELDGVPDKCRECRRK